MKESQTKEKYQKKKKRGEKYPLAPEDGVARRQEKKEVMQRKKREPNKRKNIKKKEGRKKRGYAEGKKEKRTWLQRMAWPDGVRAK